MKKSILYLSLLLAAVLMNSCENSPFFNPFSANSNLNTVIIPDYFEWDLTTTVNLKVVMEPAGTVLEPIEKQRIYLLDSTHQLLARGIIHDGTTQLYHRIPANQGRMIIYFPVTGNYEYIYSWACLGTLTFDYAWDDPNEDNGLNYLEIDINDTPDNRMKGLSNAFKASIFGNSDFGVGELVETRDLSDNYNVDGSWYVTTNKKAPASIEDLDGNPALKLGQSKNQSVEVMQTISWTEGGDFEAGLKANSPSNNRIKVKIYLYFLSRDGSLISYRYSNYNINKPDGWVDLNVNSQVPDNTAFIKLIIQDQGNSSPFYIDNVTSTYYSDPDADDDGIPDREDDYPNDASRAFNDYFPGADLYATLAYEDLWPAKGDYDFNDLVVDYQYNQIRNADNEITELIGIFQLRAIGGSFHNGFCLELPVNQELVESVSGQELQEGIVKLRSNGTESGAEKAIIPVFEDAWNYIRVEGASFVNTHSDQDQADPYIFTIQVKFTRGLSDEEAGVAPFNPFIFVNGDRGREIHLFGKEPTELMDLDLLGTGDDFSNASQSKYFNTAANLPWALDIPASFDYPEEKAPVDEAYLNFIDWAQSSGTNDNDWYQEKSGYRNPEKIFRRR